MGFSTGLSCRALGLRESISGRHKVSVRLFGRFRASDIIKRDYGLNYIGLHIMV